MMNREELEQWLDASEVRTLGLGELAHVLHVAVDARRDSVALANVAELQSLRFAIAVLRDVFSSDEGVRGWLTSPSPALDGVAPIELLAAGRVHELADLAVNEWNRPRAGSASSRRDLVAAMPYR